MSAYAGSAAIMEPVLARTRISVTCAGEALSLAAARAGLDLMKREPVHAHLWRLGERLKRGIERVVRHRGLPMRINSSGPFFATTFQDASPARAAAMHDALAAAMLTRGVFMRGRRWLLSYAHTDADIDRALAAFDEAAQEVQSGAL